MKKLICLLMATCLLLAGCGVKTPTEPINPSTEEPVIETTQEPVSSEEPAVEPAPEVEPVEISEISEEDLAKMRFNGNGEFLIDALYNAKEENVVISNTSINIALSMLLEGANGETQRQIEEYLGITKEEAKEINHKLIALLNSHGDDGLELNVANSVWCETNKVVNEDYLNLLKEYFDAEAKQVNFLEDETADMINNWCSEKTKGLINKIVDADHLKVADLRLMLINAIYFKGVWTVPYDNAEEGTFNGEKADVLRGYEGVYFENDKATGFAKPYEGGYEFIGILPKEEGEFSVSDLDIEGLLEGRTYEYEVRTQIPKFEIKYGAQLEEILPELGITDAFTPDCDLTDIGEELIVGQVKHNTYIKLDEEGTEAAAVTSIEVTDEAVAEIPEVKEVILDRPFVFMLYDTQTNTALFMGKIINLD